MVHVPKYNEMHGTIIYTCTFQEYWGEPELIIVTIAQLHSFCILYKPAVPVMSLHYN